MRGGRSGGGGGLRNPCLTMHQPWASLLVHGIKRVEGRSWPSPVTGRLWIHAASKVPDPDTVAAMEDFYREIYAVDGVHHIDFPRHYPVSRLLGCVEVVGCVRSEELVCWEDVPQSVRLEGLTDFCWLCENPQKLVVPFEMRGYQGVYNLERRVYEGAARGLSPVQGPLPVKFPLPDPRNPLSLKPGSLNFESSKSVVVKTESVSAAIAGARAAATQYSRKGASAATSSEIQTRGKSRENHADSSSGSGTLPSAAQRRSPPHPQNHDPSPVVHNTPSHPQNQDPSPVVQNSSSHLVNQNPSPVIQNSPSYSQTRNSQYIAQSSPSYSQTRNPQYIAQSSPSYSQTRNPQYIAQSSPSYSQTRNPQYIVQSSPSYSQTQNPQYMVQSSPSYSQTQNPRYMVQSTPSYSQNQSQSSNIQSTPFYFHDQNQSPNAHNSPSYFHYQNQSSTVHNSPSYSHNQNALSNVQSRPSHLQNHNPSPVAHNSPSFLQHQNAEPRRSPRLQSGAPHRLVAVALRDLKQSSLRESGEQSSAPRSWPE
ncbi:putative uncharacterized protein DDB_G0290521 isoform X1 [Hordeum vulgare subsp. vulgare]|uniref:ASCH domain-containing protein n=2 Tax=Hordeum vulgare subsp. vulgare TaxID=112509 RepID=A0A8I6XP33_HORVV|nr:putative uncharacterized protein DDB_G0290521 isoform X1 [Hordeum vulgare subsp. vulgare]XP_044946140.1 putative uncharacterized protein DDB_G0290521 isoform X1 [Hordeum vulgare subsp. vulgare]